MLPLFTTPSPVPIVINMPESSSPWWGVPVLAGIFLLVGAVIAYLSLKASDNRKAAREDQRRWDDVVRIEARKFLSSTAQVSKALEVLHKKTGSGDELSEAQALFDEHHSLMREHLDGLRIVSSDPVIEKALRIHVKISAIRMFDSGGKYESKTAIRDLSTEMVEVLRKEVGVRLVSKRTPASTSNRLRELLAAFKDPTKS